MREQHGLTMEEKPRIRFGNYELVSRIDVGGMGEVYLANQLTAFGRPVAVKIIRSDLVHDITARARFLREAEVSAHLKHEHILTLYDFGEVDGRLYLVTPYIEGGTLATRLKNRGPLSLADTHKLFVPLVQAVAYVHRRGVIHRDLKPSNVMLDSEDGEIYVRLIDFGIASLQGHSASPQLTTAGHEMGTIAYMAPERLSGIAAPSNDSFSLGVMLHQMLTARMPTTVPGSQTTNPPRLPDALLQVVRHGTATNPAERYATAEELLKGFEQAYQQVISQVAQQGTPPGGPGTSALVTNRLELDQPQSQPTPRLDLASSEKVALYRSAEMSALVDTSRPPVQVASRPPAAGPGPFAPEDYNAPTTSFNMGQGRSYSQPPPRPPLMRPRQPRQKQPGNRSRLLTILSLITILVVLGVAGMLIYGYQVASATSVAINFAPQVRVVSQVFSLKASPQVQTTDIANATIPARVFNLSKTAQQTGETTGQVNCFAVVFNCQQGVSQEDVNNLFAQIQPGLEQSITQELQNKINAAHGLQATQVQFATPVVTANPGINQPGKTVTVSVSEKGSVGYILEGDVTNVVHQQLTAAVVTQLGAGFHIIDSTITIGHPAIQGSNPASGQIAISVAGGAVASYSFPSDELQKISSGLLNKSLAQAKAFLLNQKGIDPASISIHFKSGNSSTMPGDVQHIQLIPVPPAALPEVSLTTVPGSTPGTTTQNP